MRMNMSQTVRTRDLRHAMITILFLVTLGLAAAPGAQAGLIFATNPTGSWTPGGSDMTFGTPFTVGSAGITITSLGFFDQDGDGLLSPHQVGIFNAAHTLLGSVTVPSGTAATLHDGTRWMALATPIALAANTSYMLAGGVLATGDKVNISTAAQVTVDPGFTLGTGVTYTFGSSFTYPSTTLIPGSYGFGTNMESASAVPEPSTYALLCISLGVVGFVRRRMAKG